MADFRERPNRYPNLNVSLNDQQHSRLKKSMKLKTLETCRNDECKFYSCIFNFNKNCKKLLKTTRSKKKKHNKIVMLATSKLNSIESKISAVLINNEISHEDFITITNEEKKHRELKESIRLINSQRSDVEKINLIDERKKIESYYAR